MRRLLLWRAAFWMACLLSLPRVGWALVFNAATPSNMVARFQAGTYPSWGVTNPIPNTDPSFIGLGYDWSGVGWTVSYSGHSAPLLSPRTVLEANHWPATNLMVRGSGGQLVTNDLIAANYYAMNLSGGNDLGIGTLTAPIPISAGVTYYPLIDLGAAANWSGLNALRYGWFAQVGSNSISSVDADLSGIYFNWSTNNLGEAGVVGGDSNSPDFLSYVNPLTGSNQLAVIGVHYSASYNPLPNGYWNQINTEMAKTGYSLHWVAPTNQVWTGGATNGVYTNAGNWGSAAPGTNDTVLFNATTANGQYLINLASNQMLSGIMIHAGNGNGFTFTNGVLTLGKVGIVNGDTSTNIFATSIAFNAPQNWNSGPGGLVFNGSITNNGYLLFVEGAGTTVIHGSIAGTGGVAKDGAGVLILDGTNQFQGTLFTHNGKMDLAGHLTSAGAVGGDGGELVNQGGLMILGLNTQRVVQSGGQISGTGRVWKVGDGVQVLNGSNTFSGGLEVQGGAVVFGGDSALGLVTTTSVTGNVWLNGGGLLAGSNLIYNAARGIWLGATNGTGLGMLGADPGMSLTVTGDVANAAGGVGTLVVGGGGVLQLSATNTYSGGTLVTNGALVVLNDRGFGASPGAPSVSNLMLNGGSLHVTTNLQIDANRGLAIGSAGGVMDVDSGASLSWNGTVINNAGATGIWTKTGDGTLVLNGVNNYSGMTYVSNGTFQVAGGSTVLLGTLHVSIGLRTGAVLVTGGQLATTNNSGTELADVGYQGVGNMTVSNGTWQANQVIVGNLLGSQGTLALAGGTNLLSSSLAIGYNLNATGAVWLTGGQLVTTNSATNNVTYVGNLGVGNMTVSGGSWIGNAIHVGANAGSIGTLTLAGGTNVFSGPSGVYLGTFSGGTGAVFLTGGQLVTTNSSGYHTVDVGRLGVGNMTVTGGNWLANILVVADLPGSQGRLTFAGGTNLSSYMLSIGGGAGATGVVNVTAGSLAITNAGGTAQVLVGRSGVGTLTLSGGTLTTDRLLVTNGANSTFTFSGGTLNTRSALIGAGSVFTVSNNGSAQISGVISNAGTLNVINANVVYNGNVVNQGTYVSDPSTNTFNGNFTVGPTATVVAAFGDIYAFGSNFVMQSTNRVFDMHLAQAVFADTGYGITTGNTNHTFDLSGSGAYDMGSSWLTAAQLATNFSIGTLSLAPSNHLTVMGNHLTNALSVGWLDLGGSTNDITSQLGLNVNLYYDLNNSNNAYLAGATYNLGAGQLIPIPEPSILLLVLLAPGAFWLCRNGERVGKRCRGGEDCSLIFEFLKILRFHP